MPLLFVPINLSWASRGWRWTSPGKYFSHPSFPFQAIYFVLFLFLFLFFFPLLLFVFLSLSCYQSCVLKMQSRWIGNSHHPMMHQVELYSCTSYLGTRCPAQNQQLKFHMNSPTFEPNHPDFKFLLAPHFGKLALQAGPLTPKRSMIPLPTHQNHEYLMLEYDDLF